VPSKILLQFPGAATIFAEARFDHELVADFFFAFSRAEYALKAAGLAYSGSFGEAKPDWRAFATLIASRFAERKTDPALSLAIRLLEANPPMQQTWDGEVLDWEPRQPRNGAADLENLLDQVKVVRNNLFHGGKELRGRSVVDERDGDLLAAGLTVLRSVMAIDKDVANAFSDPGPKRPVA
jgi:hypothetical protein